MSFRKKLLAADCMQGDSVFIISKKDANDDLVIFSAEEFSVKAILDNTLLVEKNGKEEGFYTFNTMVFVGDISRVRMWDNNYIVPRFSDVEPLLEKLKEIYTKKYVKIIHSTKDALEILQNIKALNSKSLDYIQEIILNAKNGPLGVMSNLSLRLWGGFNILSEQNLLWIDVKPIAINVNEDPFSYIDSDEEYVCGTPEISEEILFEDETEYLDSSVKLNVEATCLFDIYDYSEEMIVAAQAKVNEFIEFLEEMLLQNLSYLNPIVERINSLDVYGVTELEYIL